MQLLVHESYYCIDSIREFEFLSSYFKNFESVKSSKSQTDQSCGVMSAGGIKFLQMQAKWLYKQ